MCDLIMYRGSLLYNNQAAVDSFDDEIQKFENIDDLYLSGCIDCNESGVLYPKNPVSALPMDALKQSFQPGLTQSEVTSVLERIQILQPNANTTKGLSDADIVELLPSRYSQDVVEVNRFRDYLDMVLRNKAVSTSEPTLESTSESTLESTSESTSESISKSI